MTEDEAAGMAEYEAAAARAARAESLGREPEPEPEQAAPSVAVAEVMGALARIKACCTEADFVVALRTLVTLVNNALTSPDTPKLRRIRTGNKAFVARLGSKVGGVDALKAFGFADSVDAKGQAMLQLSMTEPAFVESAMAVLAQLRAILPPEGAVPAPGPGAAAAPTSGPFAAPGAAPGDGGGGGPGAGATTTFDGVSDLGAQLQSTGGLGDMMKEMQASMAANPGAAEEVAALSRGLAEGAAADPALLNDPMRAAQQLQGDPSAAEAFLNNPVFAQMGQMMMNNPAVMQQAAQLVPGAAAPAPAAGGSTVRASPMCCSCYLYSLLRCRRDLTPRACCFSCAPQDEEKMIEEALRRSMEELNQGSYWAPGDAGGGGEAGAPAPGSKSGD